MSPYLAKPLRTYGQAQAATALRAVMVGLWRLERTIREAAGR